MIPCDGILELLKETTSKRIEQILLAEWQEKKDFYQREVKKREKLMEKMDDTEKQFFEEYMTVVLESNVEKEMAIYQTGFMDGIYMIRKILEQEYK